MAQQILQVAAFAADAYLTANGYPTYGAISAATNTAIGEYAEPHAELEQCAVTAWELPHDDLPATTIWGAKP